MDVFIIIMTLFTLLCCVNPAGSPEDIDEFTLFQMIDPIAPVVNIKVFNRDSQVKAFAQVESEASAERVVEELHGKQMNIGKIKVFISHKKFISFDKSISQILARANRCSNGQISIDKSIDNAPESPPNPYLSNSLNGLKSKIQSYSSWKKQPKANPYQHFSDKIVYSREINTGFDSDEPTLHMKKKLAPCYESNMNFTKNKKNELTKTLKSLSLQTNNNCLKVSNFDIKYVSCQMLFNLFGCFGNVSKLLIHENLGHAVLEYEDEKQVQQAIKYFDCIRFFGRVLSVSGYTGPRVFDESSVSNPLNSTVYTNKTSNHRFAPKTISKVILPSRQLIISGFSSSITVDYVKQFVSKIHAPIKIDIQEGSEDSGLAFLVEFSFLYESFKVLSILHNSEYENQVLFVSFIKAIK